MSNLIKVKVARLELGKPGGAIPRGRIGILMSASGQSGCRYVDLKKLREVNVPATFEQARGRKHKRAARRDCPACGRNVSVLRGQLHHHLNATTGQKCLGKV